MAEEEEGTEKEKAEGDASRAREVVKDLENMLELSYRSWLSVEQSRVTG